MSNISEQNLKRLAAQVGFQITGYYSNEGGDTFAVAYINDQGEKENKIINKQDFTEGFKVNKATVGVKDNPTYSDVYKAFSDKYNLGLIEGVDYLKNDNLVNLQTIAIITLTINPNSILYTGSVTVTVYRQTAAKEFSDAAARMGNALRGALRCSMFALGRPVDPKGVAFVGNQITNATVQALKARYGHIAFFDDMQWDDLAGGTIANYQTWRKTDGVQAVKVYVRALTGKIYSFSVFPLNDEDRPVKN